MAGSAPTRPRALSYRNSNFFRLEARGEFDDVESAISGFVDAAAGLPKESGVVPTLRPLSFVNAKEQHCRMHSSAAHTARGALKRAAAVRG